MTWPAVLAALVSAGVVYQAIGSARARRRFPAPGSWINAGGRRLHVVCRGSGTPGVLLEAGIAASSISWAAVQPAVAAFTRVCAYDRAGLAWSDPSRRPRTVAHLLEDLDAVRAYLAGEQPAVLVGHSFGGFLVRAYAARHPGLVAGLVLVDPPTEWWSISRERRRLLRGARGLSRLGALLARMGVVRACLAILAAGRPGPPRQVARFFGPTVARTLERLVGEVRKLPPDSLPIVQAHWSEPRCFHAMADYLRVLAESSGVLAAAAPTPEIPVVVISSARQPAPLIEAQRQLAASSARGRHVVAPRSGHWVLFDEPELIADLVRDLVSAARTAQFCAGFLAWTFARS